MGQRPLTWLDFWEMLTLKMKSIPELLKIVPSAQAKKGCMRLYDENADRFSKAWGSSHNHQAWPGGYLHHIRAVMNLANVLYPTVAELAKEATTIKEGPSRWAASSPKGMRLPFLRGDAMLVLFLHDLEKPWRQETGSLTKVEKQLFRQKKIKEYGILLSPEQENAIRYVEGEGDDYSSSRRTMNELAAFCHMCDVASARIFHSEVL
jgi:hypothetical protein